MDFLSLFEYDDLSRSLEGRASSSPESRNYRYSNVTHRRLVGRKGLSHLRGQLIGHGSQHRDIVGIVHEQLQLHNGIGRYMRGSQADDLEEKNSYQQNRV